MDDVQALQELKNRLLDIPEQLTRRLWEAQSRDEVEAILTDACLSAVINYLDTLPPDFARHAWQVESQA